MIPPPLLTELEEDEEKDLKKWGGWREGWMGGSLNRVISRAPVFTQIMGNGHSKLGFNTDWATSPRTAAATLPSLYTCCLGEAKTNAVYYELCSVYCLNTN